MLDPDTLIQRYLEGSLTAAEAGHLHRLLEKQPELAEQLIQQMEVDAMLRATSPQAAAMVSPPASPLKQRLNFSIVTSILAVAACITLLAIWFVAPWLRSDEEDATDFVAVFTRGVDLEWESAVITPGNSLVPGRLKLKSGIAQIEFYQGARIAIEGPAEIQLVSGNEATCTRGKITATVPPQAKGFRINTPKGSIIDYGTEFGLDVGATKSEVHVFKGEIALHKASEAIKMVTAGQAISFAAEPKSLPANPSNFTSLSEFNARADLLDQSRLKRWQAQNAKLQTDPSLRFHFDFQDAPTAHSLRNHAPNGEDGSMVATSWTGGRWPGKSALDFRNVSDRVRLSIPFETEALTMAISLRVNGLNPQFNSLLMSDAWGQHKIHWQILANGKIRLAVGVPHGWGKAYEYDTPVYFTPERFGSWVHLAVVIDPAAQEVRHYVNGTLLARIPAQGSVLLKIGNAELGNWNKGGLKTKVNIPQLSGAMDEFTLWDRALSDAEIAAIAK